MESTATGRSARAATAAATAAPLGSAAGQLGAEATEGLRTEPSYARYALLVLTIVYVFNFVDRNIISILSEQLKADLGVSDAQIGFLYGTAFAVFYSVFGIPLGAVADIWDRRKLIAIGLAFWSAMTALSGMARGFTGLAMARVGVGVGEASATPAAYSLLSDYFPPERRTTAIAFYASGVSIGIGLGVFLPGLIVATWNSLYPTADVAPLGLRGWQAAYFAVGLPGLLMALWVSTLREPVRGSSEGRVHVQSEQRPVAVFFRELLALLPVTSFVILAGAGASTAMLAVNVISAIVLAGIAFALISALGPASIPQWTALTVGVFAAIAWAQNLSLRDRASFKLICQSKSLRFIAISVGFISFTGYGYAVFTPGYFQRVRGASLAEVTIWASLGAAVGGWLGATLGGLLTDALLKRTRRARLMVITLSALAQLPAGLIMLSAESKWVSYFASFCFSIASGLWFGPGPASVQDLVLPRMRSTASAAYLLVLTLIGLALGPYTFGLLSGTLGGLDKAMRYGLVGSVTALFFLALASIYLVRDESTVRERARAAGEPI